MNSEQIYKILKNDAKVEENNFLGVFPLDMIPLLSIDYPCCFVVNTKGSNHSGEHWIAIWKDENNIGYYFDSFGAPPKLDELVRTLDFCKMWSYNTTQIQSLLSSVCGQYVIFWLTHMARNYSTKQIERILNTEGDFNANDAFVNQFVVHNYDINSLKVYDFPFIRKQVAEFLKHNDN